MLMIIIRRQQRPMAVRPGVHPPPVSVSWGGGRFGARAGWLMVLAAFSFIAILPTRSADSAPPEVAAAAAQQEGAVVTTPPLISVSSSGVLSDEGGVAPNAIFGNDSVWPMSGGEKVSDIVMDSAGTLASAPDAALPDSANHSGVVTDPPIRNKWFRPFVLVRIPYDSLEPDEFDGGEVLGVSDNRIAVGYLINSNDDHIPFMFSAASDSVTILDLGSGVYDTGEATCISPDGTIIGGMAFNHANAVDVAVTWNPSTNQINPTLGTNVASRWNAITDSGWLAGAYLNGSQTESVVIDGTGLHYPEPSSAGEATGINSTGHVCGWYLDQSHSGRPQGYRWYGGNSYNLLAGAFPDGCGANCIDDAGNIGGWVALDGPVRNNPALWRVLSPSQDVYAEIEPFHSDIASSEVVANNDHSEMLINRVDQPSGYGVALWTNGVFPGVGAIDEPNQIYNGPDVGILMPNTDDELYTGKGMNDDLWVGGSYLLHGTGTEQPCLVIPYNINNNKDANGDWLPDYREIVDSGYSGYQGANGHMDDQDPGWRWLIDEGENIQYYPGTQPGGMRVGLNTPGYSDAYTPTISNTQVVRLQVGANNPDYVNSNIPDDGYFVNGIIADSNSQCAPFDAAINNWSHVSTGHGREIVIMIRSNFMSNYPQYDFLCDPNHVNLGTGVTPTAVLANLHTFAYKYAHCIDWVQLGNESYDATDDNGGEYVLWPDQLEHGGCWSGSSIFSLIPNNPNDPTCIDDALHAVENWQHDQMWAILEGSALAGRPLRIVGPGITNETLHTGGQDYQRTTNEWHEIDSTINWDIENQVWFDMHAHYKTVAEATGAIYDILHGPWSSGGPGHVTCLEFAPELDETVPWWTYEKQTEFPEFMIPNGCGGTRPTENWGHYIGVDGWSGSQFGGTDLGISTIADALFINSFDVIAYRQTLQLKVPDYLFDLAALRANQVCDDSIQTTYKFTIFTTTYQNAAAEYQINDFNPHSEDCQACSGN